MRRVDVKTDLLSVSREKKKPQVGFMVVWNGDMELERRGVEEEGREAPSDGCRREEGGEGGRTGEEGREDGGGREGGRGRKGGRTGEEGRRKGGRTGEEGREDRGGREEDGGGREEEGREDGGGREDEERGKGGGRGRKGGRRLQSTISGVLGTHNYT